jgi:SAM-dependent methyltransferase
VQAVNFSKEWDQRYIENTHLSVWPWSDMVSLVRRHCGELRNAGVLELGCGAGANIPFFLSLGVRYHSVEGSPSMVKRLHERFPDLAGRIVAGDFTSNLVFESEFDLIVDRASLTHNSTQAIEAGLRLVRRALKPGGYFVGVDWFSTRYGEFRRGARDADEYTRGHYEDGPFAGTGRVHFADESHLRRLFAGFELLILEEKVVRSVVPAGNDPFAAWNLVARRPNV